MHIPMRAYWQLLRSYLRPQRGAVLLMSLLLLASIALQLIGPQVARSFIDAARTGAGQNRLLQVALLFIGVSVGQQGLRVLAMYWSERVAWTATNALRADLAAHLLRLDLSFHQRRTPGELIERVDGDINALAGFFSSFVVQLVGSLLLLLGVVVALYGVDLQLGVAFTIFALLSLALLVWVRRFATPYWHADREHSAAFYGYVGEVMAAAEDVRSSGAVPYAMQRFFGHLRSWLPVGQRADLWGNVVWMTAVALFAAGDALAYGLGGGLYRADAISLGAVYLVVAYVAMLAAPIETIRTEIQDLQRADAGIARVRELFSVRSRLADGEHLLPTGAPAVEFDSVSFHYDDNGRRPTTTDHRPTQHATRNTQHNLQSPISATLQDISFRLKPGHVLGLLGHTGSGKSTIARLLFRQYDPQHGAVRVGGVDLRQARISASRARVGLVTQDVQLFEASLRDNLTFFNPAIADERLFDVLTTLGLDAWLARLPHGLDTIISGASLSAGEAQLIALARVFLKDPGLVILDEASSQLDPATEALLERALNTLLHGRTAIIIAHRLSTIERADDILILDQGRVLEYGPRTQLAADRHSRFAALRKAGLINATEDTA